MEIDKTKWPFYLIVLLEQTKVTQALKSYSKETFNSANGQFFVVFVVLLQNKKYLRKITNSSHTELIFFKCHQFLVLLIIFSDSALFNFGNVERFS